MAGYWVRVIRRRKPHPQRNEPTIIDNQGNSTGFNGAGPAVNLLPITIASACIAKLTMAAIANVARTAGPRILLQRTALFVCDVQEKFRPRMWRFPELISTGSKMLDVAKILDMPVLVTEQYPSGIQHCSLLSSACKRTDWCCITFGFEQDSARRSLNSGLNSMRWIRQRS